MDEQKKLFDEGKGKKGYWTKYNKSQTQEKVLFIQLLKELCDNLPKKWKITRTKPLALAKIIFCLCMKEYCLKSGRRIIGELELAKKLGYIDRVPHFNTLFNYLRNPRLTIVLQELVRLTSLPLTAVERKFCGDSTGIATGVLHDRWSMIRQNYAKHHEYMKLHGSFGTLTNILTSVRVTEGTQADSPILPELVDETCENFKAEEYSWDKAYSSRENLQKIANKNCLPLIPFKSNASGRRAGGSMVWTEMYNFFKKNNALFMKKYHLRSNAEAGFKMLKDRFGDFTYMKFKTGMINDSLARCVSHNLCILCQEIFLLGIDIDFAHFKFKVAQDI